MNLRLVAGTDVAAPPVALIRPDVDQFDLRLLDPIVELFELHLEARSNYRRAMAEVARRTGRSVRSAAHVMQAVRAARARKSAKALEPEDAKAVLYDGPLDGLDLHELEKALAHRLLEVHAAIQRQAGRHHPA